jgi:hypothetical protein
MKRTTLLLLGSVCLLLILGFRLVRQIMFHKKGFNLFSNVLSSAGPVRFRIHLESFTQRSLGNGDPYERNSISITAVDQQNREKETPDTEIRVNDVPLRYSVGRGNYYDRHPHFELSNERDLTLAPDRTYAFTVQNEGRPAQPLAEIRTPPPFDLEQLDVPKSLSKGQPLEIRYSNLKSAVELVAYKTLATKDERGDETFVCGSKNQPEAFRKTLKGSGQFAFPSDYLLAPTGQRVASVGMEFTLQSTGSVAARDFSGSEITAVRRIELVVDVTPP